jgi:hypothetical protein
VPFALRWCCLFRFGLMFRCGCRGRRVVLSCRNKGEDFGREWRCRTCWRSKVVPFLPAPKLWRWGRPSSSSLPLGGCGTTHCTHSAIAIPCNALLPTCSHLRARTLYAIERGARHVQVDDLGLHSVSTEFAVVTVRGSGHPRGMSSVTGMAALQAEQRCEPPWHPRV